MTQKVFNRGKSTRKAATGEKVYFAAIRNESLCCSSEMEAKNGDALSQHSQKF